MPDVRQTKPQLINNHVTKLNHQAIFIIMTMLWELTQSQLILHPQLPSLNGHLLPGAQVEQLLLTNRHVIKLNHQSINTDMILSLELIQAHQMVTRNKGVKFIRLPFKLMKILILMLQKLQKLFNHGHQLLDAQTKVKFHLMNLNVIINQWGMYLEDTIMMVPLEEN